MSERKLPAADNGSGITLHNRRQSEENLLPADLMRRYITPFRKVLGQQLHEYLTSHTRLAFRSAPR